MGLQVDGVDFTGEHRHHAVYDSKGSPDLFNSGPSPTFNYIRVILRLSWGYIEAILGLYCGYIGLYSPCPNFSY